MSKWKETDSGCGCVLFAVAVILLFNIGGVTTAIAHVILTWSR